MSDYSRIDRLIREAHVQRSAALGMAIGEFLADSYLLLAKLGRKAFGTPRQPTAVAPRQGKTVSAP